MGRPHQAACPSAGGNGRCSAAGHAEAITKVFLWLAAEYTAINGAMQVKLVSEDKLAQTEGAALVWSLTQGRIYTVLGIEGDDWRLLHDNFCAPDNEPPFRPRPDLRSDEEKEARPYPERYAPVPTLFPSELFEVVNSSEPNFWVCKFGADGERYCYPKEWMYAGFWEDYFARSPEAHRIFWDVCYRFYSGG